jgi:TetR/AcrR family transcriptional regulator, cholesterol catabolism regulator
VVAILGDMAPRKDRAKSLEKKDKILRTTLQLFLKKGSYTATSTTDICSAARIVRPSLYYYFGSKRNLLFSLHMDHINKVLKPYLEKASSIEDPLERLTYMVEAFTKDVIGQYPELRFLIHDSLSIKDRYFKEVRQEWKKHYLLLRSTIEELQRQGRARKDVTPSWAALFMLGMITWVTFWLDYDRPEEVDKIADSAVEFVLHGLAVKTAGVRKTGPRGRP